MRVIAGQAKGRRLFSPPQKGVRPTTDFAREALFNILPSPVGCEFGDLYAGSGAVGVEALSRGAARVVFVESDAAAATVIKKNAALCGFTDRCEVLTEDINSAVTRMITRGESLDVLFADPPYAAGALATMLGLLTKKALLKNGGVLVVQHAPFDNADENLHVFKLTDRRKYGNTVFSFYNN